MRQPLAYFVLATAWLCGACASRPVAPAQPSTQATVAPAPAVEVRIQHLAATPGRWEVEYRLPTPVKSVRFARPGGGFRQSHWKVLEPQGLRISPADDVDAVSAEDGRAFGSFRVEVSEYAVKPEKDYQALIPYAGGGVLLYTGVFELERPAGDTRFELVPAPGEHVVVAGHRHEKSAPWQGPQQGTYAYFGLAEVVEEGVTAVIDPGMPQWLRTAVVNALPRVFALYTERTGQPLPYVPTLFLSYGQDARPGTISISGGALEGLIQLEVRLGSNHARESPEVRAMVLEVAAHEAAHLWNGQLLSHEVQGGDWMHEGGAEAFALGALRRLGEIPREREWQRLSSAASECVTGLERAPLRMSSRPGKYVNYYRCGLLFFAMAEASARQQRPDADVFSLWGQLFRDAGPEGHYDEAKLLAALARGGVSEQTLRVVRSVVEGPNEDVEARLLEELRRLGFNPETDRDGP